MKTNLGIAGLNIAVLLAVGAFTFKVQAVSPGSVPKVVIQSITDALDNVVCTSAPTAEVYSENLNKVVFQAKAFEGVKLFQGWNESKKTVTIGGVPTTFIKVQVSGHSREELGIGWIKDSYVRTRGACVDQLGGPSSQSSASAVIPLSAPAQASVISSSITGLNDPKCCIFPLKAAPTASYQTGMRRFGHSRGKGRLHAANDLYHRYNSPIVAVGPGTVIRQAYRFYEGTFALEIKHQGGFVARYGEIRKAGPKGILNGAKVKMGQQIALMSKVDSNCCSPMLHFELYSGARKGALNQNGNRYQRRKDLLNPTPYLIKWQRKSRL